MEVPRKCRARGQWKRVRRGKEVGVGCCKVCRAPWPIVRWRNGFECFRLGASSSESGGGGQDPLMD